MTPIVLGSGLAPAVTIVDGLVYVAFGVQPDALVLVVLTPQGTEVRRVVIADGFFNSFPRFSGPWLVYKRNHDWRPAALHVETGQTWTYRGQADGNFGVVVNADFNLVAYQWGHEFPIRLGSLFDGSDAPTSMRGAPDGLDVLVDPSRVTLRKDTRESVPGMLYPVRAGDLVVGERPDAGVAVLIDGELHVALSGQDTPTPSCATDGQTYGLVTGGPQGVRLLLGTRADLEALPLASSFQLPVTVPAIGRPLWFGFYRFGDTPINAPGNCELHVDADMLVRSRDGTVLWHYVAGASDSDPASIEAAIVSARRWSQGVPVLAYWPRRAQASPPPSADGLAVELYRLRDEPVDAFERRGRAGVAKAARPAWLVGQGYSSNQDNTTDLASIPPVCARIARDCPNVEGILVFSAGTRATGWSDHPEVHDAWRQLAAGIAGTPALPPAADTVQPPSGPPPVDPVPPNHPPTKKENEPMNLSVTDIRAIRDGLRHIYMAPEGLNRRARHIDEPVIFHDRGFEEWEAVAIAHALEHGVAAGIEEAYRQIRTFPEYQAQHPTDVPP